MPRVAAIALLCLIAYTPRASAAAIEFRGQWTIQDLSQLPLFDATLQSYGVLNGAFDFGMLSLIIAEDSRSDMTHGIYYITNSYPSIAVTNVAQFTVTGQGGTLGDPNIFGGSYMTSNLAFSLGSIGQFVPLWLKVTPLGPLPLGRAGSFENPPNYLFPDMEVSIAFSGLGETPVLRSVMKAVPEPGVWQFLGFGLFVVGARWLSRKSKSASHMAMSVIALLALASSVHASPITPTGKTNPLSSFSDQVIDVGLFNGVPWQFGSGGGGVFPTFSVGYGLNVPGLGASPGTFESRPIMEFDLTSLMFDGTNAFLSLYVLDGNTANAGIGVSPLQVEIYGYGGDGVYTVTDAVQGTLLTTLSLNATGPISLNLNAFAASLLLSGNNWLGLNIRPIINPSVSSAYITLYRPPTLGPAGSGIVPVPRAQVPESSTLTSSLGALAITLVAFWRRPNRLNAVSLVK